MALIAACVLDPGVYFAMNAPAAAIGTTVESAAQAIAQWGFVVTPEMLTQTAVDIGETTILSRTGGAPTLAVGMAQILHGIAGGSGGMLSTSMAFWYHYAILFEALFILTTIDAGTRVARFMIQEVVGLVVPSFKRTESWVANVACTALAVAGWGWFLYQGVVDPLGGINTLWPLFGIANQMLAGLAMIFVCATLVKMKRERYLWVAALPTTWLLACTLTAGWQKLFHADPKIGFLSNAARFSDALARGELLAPAKSIDEMRRVIFNNQIDAALCALFMGVVVLTLVFALRAALKARRSATPTAMETPYAALDALR
jgi:carbon starvation protein CstA